FFEKSMHRAKVRLRRHGFRVVLEESLPSNNVSSDFSETSRRFRGCFTQCLSSHGDNIVESILPQHLQNCRINAHRFHAATWIPAGAWLLATSRSSRAIGTLMVMVLGGDG